MWEGEGKMKEINLSYKKINMGSTGIVNHNLLIPGYDLINRSKYLNVFIGLFNSCAGMVEWLTQLADTQRPLGFVGSIPTPSAANSNFLIGGFEEKIKWQT